MTVPRATAILYTFGDSILDCGAYNEHAVTPGHLIVRNDDRLFPEFRGDDLASRGHHAWLVHRARDGATVGSLELQIEGLKALMPFQGQRAVALLTIGGNDLLRGLVTDPGPGVERFAASLRAFLERLPIRPVLVGNVYDPSFGDDRRNFLGIEPRVARESHRRMQAVLEDAASRYGTLVDLHAHFLRGDETWYAQTIEPSLRGASEVRRAFLPPVLEALKAH